MTDASNNNSGNNSQGGTVVITGSGGGGGGGAGSGQWISVGTGKTYTINIPIATSGNGLSCSGGTITWAPGTGTPQISFDDIDLAVPVDEKKEISDGCTCKKCKEYYQYAEPNQDDGTLICYGCRMVW